MNKPLSVLAFVFLSIASFATTPVTGVIKDLGTQASWQGTYVRLYLRGCSAFAPYVNGTTIFPKNTGGGIYKDFAPDANGNISGTIYSTRAADGISGGEVTCNGSTTAVWIGVVIVHNGSNGNEVPVHSKNGVTLDLTNLSPINPTVSSPDAPTGDARWCLLSGANCGFTGAITGKGATFQKVNDIRYADQFAGADCGAKIMAADADLGATPGEIWINRNCGIAITTAITPSANHVLRWIQGGTDWTMSSKITMNFIGNSIKGPGSGAFKLTCTANQDCIRWQISPFSVSFAGEISGITISGNSGGSAAGIHLGDAIGPKLDDVVITGFTGGKGLWMDNVTNWTERWNFRKLHLDNNLYGAYFTNTTGGAGAQSFGYGYGQFYLNVNAGQTGIRSDGTNSVFLYRSHIETYGNAAGAITAWINLTGNSNWADEKNWFEIGGEASIATIGIVVASGSQFCGYGVEQLSSMTDSNANAASAGCTFEILPGQTQNSLDAGTEANYLGSSITATFHPILKRGKDLPWGLHFMTGTNVNSVEAIVQNGVGNGFSVGSLNPATAPSGRTRVFTVDYQGNVFAGIGNAAAQLSLNSDVVQVRDGANSLGLRNGTNVQTSCTYGTSSSANANYERLCFTYDGGTSLFSISAQAAGTGTARGIEFSTNGSPRWQFNTSGHLLPIADATYDEGSNANRARDLYASRIFRTGQSANSDSAGQITVSASTTGTYSFSTTYTTAPICTLTPTGDPTAVGVWWVTVSTTTLTANVKTSGTITFDYVCIGRN